MTTKNSRYAYWLLSVLVFVVAILIFLMANHIGISSTLLPGKTDDSYFNNASSSRNDASPRTGAIAGTSTLGESLDATSTGALQVMSLNPTSGIPETIVTILGAGFSGSNNIVYLGGTAAAVSVQSYGALGSQQVLKVVIPSSAGPGTYGISVRNESGALSNSVPFEVLAR